MPGLGHLAPLRSVEEDAALVVIGADPRLAKSELDLVPLVTEAKSITRYLRALGEPTEPPSRGPPRGPPYWASRALRRHAGDLDAA